MKKLMVVMVSVIICAQASGSVGLDLTLGTLAETRLSGLDQASQGELANTVEKIFSKKVRARLTAVFGIDRLLTNSDAVLVTEIEKNQNGFETAEIIASQKDLTDMASRTGLVFVQVIE